MSDKQPIKNVKVDPVGATMQPKPKKRISTLVPIENGRDGQTATPVLPKIFGNQITAQTAHIDNVPDGQMSRNIYGVSGQQQQDLPQTLKCIRIRFSSRLGWDSSAGQYKG